MRGSLRRMVGNWTRWQISPHWIRDVVMVAVILKSRLALRRSTKKLSQPYRLSAPFMRPVDIDSALPLLFCEIKANKHLQIV